MNSKSIVKCKLCFESCRNLYDRKVSDIFSSLKIYILFDTIYKNKKEGRRIMFCTKCGYNAGTAKFCPKCGNPLNPQPVQETPVQSEPVAAQPVQETPVQSEPVAAQPVQETPVQSEPVAAQPVQSQPVQQFGTQPQADVTPQQQFGTQPQFNAASQQQFGTQPQFGAVPPVNGDVPRYQAADPMQPQPKKKKKKWPLVAVILIALAAVITAVVIVVLPKLKKELSPTKQAVTAIKNVGASLEDSVDKLFDNLGTNTVSDKNEISGTFKFDNMTVNGESYSKYVKADSIKYDIQTDTSLQKAAGDLKLQNGSTELLTVSFYTDGSTVYFKIPELFTETFSMSVDQIAKDTDIDSSFGYSFDMSDISSYLSVLNSGDFSQYKEPAKAAAKALAKGIDVFADACQYGKNDSLTYKSDNGDIEVTEYSVTVTEEAVKAGVNAAVDALYADSTTSTYMSMLTIAGVTQDSLKEEVASSIQGMDPVTFSMYVNKDDAIVRISIDNADVNGNSNGTIAISFVGKDNISDYVVIEANADDTNMKFTVQNADNRSSVAFDMKQGSEYMKMALDCSLSGSTVAINNMSIDMNIDDVKANMKITGDYSQKEFSTMKYSSSSFPKPVNVDKMTSAQQTALATELVKNSAVFKKIISDDLYKQLFSAALSGN